MFMRSPDLPTHNLSLASSQAVVHVRVNKL